MQPLGQSGLLGSSITKSDDIPAKAAASLSVPKVIPQYLSQSDHSLRCVCYNNGGSQGKAGL